MICCTIQKFHMGIVGNTSIKGKLHLEEKFNENFCKRKIFL